MYGFDGNYKNRHILFDYRIQEQVKKKDANYKIEDEITYQACQSDVKKNKLKKLHDTKK